MHAVSPAGNDSRVASEDVHARFLLPSDVPALHSLEEQKWDCRQAASRATLAARIQAHPGLCVGAFDTRSRSLLASLFLRPVAPDFWRHARAWQDCVEAPAPTRGAALFGISLSSRHGGGVDALLRFFWPHALKGGWRHIYLGSTIPGLRDWRQREAPSARCVDEYVRCRRRGRPLDPQLRYYDERGFRDIVCVKPDYFPHPPSLDHGVILRGTVPLSRLSPLWRALPLAQVQWVTRGADLP